jgi:hypothetical protein
MGSAGLEDLYLQNKIVGDGTSDGTARVILKAQGWENAAGGSSTTEASITLTSSNANQQVDLTAPVIQFSGSTSVSVLTASFKVNNAAANLEVTNGTTTMSTQPGFFGTTSNHAWIVLTNNGTNSTYCAAGGFTVGAPTGGCKGAGTANFAADIYKNNSAYGNPDFVFEHWATGKIEKFAQNDGASTYRGLMPLDDLQRYVRRHYRYPLIPDGPVGMFGRADIVLALTEQNTLYLFQLADRLAALEFEVARLKGGR